MQNTDHAEQAHPDWALILALGGPAKVAEILGLPKNGGVQRVQNWKHRGIPPAVKVQYPALFLNGAPEVPKAPTPEEPAKQEQ